MTIELNRLIFPTLFEVVRGPEGSFSSKLISLQDFEPGEVLVKLGPECKLSKTKRYTSVQFSEVTEETDEAHFELGSELVYINHSCEPNVAFELAGGFKGLQEGRWCLKSLTEIKKGDALSFAYFSTEWDMAQPFQCQCHSKSCLGLIRGAKYLPMEILDRFFINEHILRMKHDSKHES